MTEIPSFPPASGKAVSSKSLDTGKDFELLCALAATRMTPQRIQRVASFLSDRSFNRSAVDWVQLLRLAEDHGVLPLVARNLTEHVADLPPEIERRLRSAYEANLRRSLWFAAELRRILQHFQLRQLQVVPFKGPWLASSIYGDCGLRSFSDLDLLLDPVDFEPAKQALIELGYRVSASTSPSAERFLLRFTNECVFDSAGDANIVELQWALLPRFYAVELLMRDLLARSTRTRFEGLEISCLSPEDSLLALSLHAAKHLWTRLIWLTDIAETLRSQTIDYLLISARARELGIARSLGISLWLVKTVLGLELPKGAEHILAADSDISALGAEFSERLARGEGYDFESTRYFRQILKLRERRLDRWRTVWRLVWTPGAGEVAAVKLPEALFPLYRIVRLGRLIGKLV